MTATNHEDLAADQMRELITLARRAGEGRRARRARRASRTGQWEESRLGLASVPAPPEPVYEKPPAMPAEQLAERMDELRQTESPAERALRLMVESRAADAGMAPDAFLARNRERSRLSREAELADRKANVTLRAQCGRVQARRQGD